MPAVKEARAMRRVFGDALMSAAAIGVVLIALTFIDERVRMQISQQIVAHPVSTLADSGARVRDLIGIVASAVRSQSLSNAPLAIFAVAGGVLLVFMLRT